jgi:hypothetical protein
MCVFRLHLLVRPCNSLNANTEAGLRALTSDNCSKIAITLTNLCLGQRPEPGVECNRPFSSIMWRHTKKFYHFWSLKARIMSTESPFGGAE